MRFTKLLLILPILLVLLITHNLSAHTANQVDHLMWYKISNAGKRLDVKFVVDFGFETATNMLYIYDKDKNKQINGEEKASIGNDALKQWIEEFKVMTNKVRVPAKSTRFDFVNRELTFVAGGFTVTFYATFETSVDANEIFWEIEDSFLIYQVGYYKYDIEIRNAIILGKHLAKGKETNPWGLNFTLKCFDRDVGVTTIKINEETEQNDLVRIKNTQTQKTDKPANTETINTKDNSSKFDDDDIDEVRSKRSEKDDRFVGLLKAEPLSWEGLVGLFIAFLLGMYHAMSPGHGKALVGSYLITSKGTFRDAVFLSMTVTITHTGSVFLFGVVILLLSHELTPSTFVPYLTLASGALIIMIGFWIVITRSEHWGSHSHDHDHGHGHSHSHGLCHTHSHSHDEEHSHEHHHHDHNHEHSHSHEHTHDHEHLDHSHDPKVCRNVDLIRDKLNIDVEPGEENLASWQIAQPVEDLSGQVFDVADDEIEEMDISAEEHSHKIQLMAQEQAKTQKPKKEKRRRSGVSLKELLMLGITGGMVPCPTAIVVLLIAVALGKTFYGLMLIVTFSFGLAFILGALGVVMVITKKFMSKSGRFAKLAQIAPVISGILITYIGWLIIFGALTQLGLITFELNFLR